MNHVGFIVAAFAVTGVAVLAMVGALLWEGRGLRRALGRLDRAP